MRDEIQQTTGYYAADAGDLAAFRDLIGRQLDPADVPFAAEVQRNVPIYDMGVLCDDLSPGSRRQALLAEWARVLKDGAGVIVLRAAYADTAPVDRASEVFRAIIAGERAVGAGKGDHFAASGANDRVWNALQKHCLKDPEGFALYYGNPAIAAACDAWLGPDYQVTAQVNQVRPGGKAQTAHRDYHLGFQTAEGAARYPVHAHAVTATLTLQGGIAHCDMPVESGPTRLLPFSQLYPPGYVAFHDAGHRGVFEDHHIQLPLKKGDAVFFNPALFHAAGENKSADIERMMNLLQVSSAFGRAMEAVDRDAMCRALYPVLCEGGMDTARTDAAIAACAEGYPFPTNLDTDPPVGGNAPQNQAELMRTALDERLSVEDFTTRLTALANRRKP